MDVSFLQCQKAQIQLISHTIRKGKILNLKRESAYSA